MKITILGSGTALPTADRCGPSVLVEIENDLIVIDMGAGCLTNLEKAGYSYRNISHICFTHHHPDHTTELIRLFFAFRNGNFPLNRKELKIVATEEFFLWMDKLKEPYSRWIAKLPFELVRCNIDKVKKFDEAKWSVSGGKVNHIESSTSFTLKSLSGQTFVVSGDTDYCESIIDSSKNADILLLECTMPENEKRIGHLIPSEAGKIAGKAGVKKLVLTHFYPQCRNFDMLTPAKNYFDGEIILAEDLMTIEIL